MDRLDRALAEFEAALAQVEAARAGLHEAIVGALDDGVIQAEIVRRTGYTRERVRQIARAAGRESKR